ncbi:MAG: ZrgA family zinc uptake protein, partial [Bacteriovorax sp.]
MKMHLLLVGFAFFVNAMAGEHSLGAHEHGAIKLGMAIEKNAVDIDLDGPSESFIGFEYLPKTAKDKKTFNDAKDLWEKKLLTLITLDKKLECKITEASFKQVIDEKESAEEQAKIKDPKKKEQGVHSDIEAKAKITCAKDVAGSEVQISLRKQFKNIK